MFVLHWAAIPLETVFEGYENMSFNWLETESQGVKMVVEPMGNGTGKIVLLLSLNPSDYLNPSFTPGSIVSISQAK